MDIICECGHDIRSHSTQYDFCWGSGGCKCKKPQYKVSEDEIYELLGMLEGARFAFTQIRNEVPPPPTDNYPDEEEAAEWDIVPSEGAENIYRYCTEALAALEARPVPGR